MLWKTRPFLKGGHMTLSQVLCVAVCLLHLDPSCIDQAALAMPPLTLGTSPALCPRKALESISQGTSQWKLLAERHTSEQLIR